MKYFNIEDHSVEVCHTRQAIVSGSESSYFLSCKASQILTVSVSRVENTKKSSYLKNATKMQLSSGKKKYLQYIYLLTASLV